MAITFREIATYQGKSGMASITFDVVPEGHEKLTVTDVPENMAPMSLAEMMSSSKTSFIEFENKFSGKMYRVTFDEIIANCQVTHPEKSFLIIDSNFKSYSC